MDKEFNFERSFISEKRNATIPGENIERMDFGYF